VSQPPHKSAAIPTTVLHRFHDPAQIFNRDDGITPHVRQTGYLLRGDNRQLALLSGCRLTVELSLIQSGHACLPVMQQRRSLSFEVSDLLLRRAHAVP
jgi:hypothetical protein